MHAIDKSLYICIDMSLTVNNNKLDELREIINYDDAIILVLYILQMGAYH